MHPDTGGSNELAMAINEAVEVLLDASKRSRFDLERRIGRAKTFAASSVPHVIENRVEVFLAVCLTCGATNRLADSKAIAEAMCGACGTPFTPAGASKAKHQAPEPEPFRPDPIPGWKKCRGSDARRRPHRCPWRSADIA